MERVLDLGAQRLGLDPVDVRRINLVVFGDTDLTPFGLGAFVAHLIWRQIDTSDPPAAAIVVSAMAGGIGAMLLQRYVIVVATAFSGAWTMIVGGLSIASELARRNAVKPLPAGDVWILYPFTAASENRWVVVAWVVLSIAGIVVQLAFSSKKRK